MDSQKEKEVISRFGIDVDRLKREQIKLAKGVSLKDDLDFDHIEFIGGVSNIIIQGKIISTIVILNKSLEVIEQKYFIDKVNFPYLPEFRAYRELPAIISCLERVEQKPSLIFIEGLGINHVRLGIASHLSISSGIPAIGVSDKEVGFSINGDYIFLSGKKVGKVIKTKQGSKPLFVSPGSGISLETCVKMVERFVQPPHKLPEPLRAARKYAKKIQKELFK